MTTTEVTTSDAPRPLFRRVSAWMRNEARSETLQAAFVLLVEIVLFMWTPISRFDTVHFSAADLTQSFSLTRIEPGHQPGNQLQSDGVTQMKPWTMLNREELALGQMPLWNPWNGAGCPHFANYQSAVFSPFTVPCYVLSMKLALLVAAVMKLFALGFFTYLFLRKIGVRHLAALVGVTVFTFAGHNALLLYFPHVGALVALPGGMYFVECAFQRCERARAAGTRAVLRGPLVGLTLVLLAGLLAGNPEPFYFAAVLIALYSTARLVALWRAGHAWRDVGALAVKLVFAGVVAGGLAAFQLLPFFEYLGQSRVLEQRSQVQTPLDPIWWPLMLFPDVLGNPASPYKLSDTVPPPNYELVVAAYVGGAAIVLALLSVLFARKNRYAWFFALAGVTWIAYAYDLFGAASLFTKIPTVGMAPMNRSQGVWNFIVACSAALCVEHVSRAEGRRRWLHVMAIAVLGTAGLVACLAGADALIGKFATYDSPNHQRFLQFVPEHIRAMSVVFASSLGILILLWLARSNAARNVAMLSLVACTFMSTGWLLHDYNPTCEDRFFFPVTPAIKTLQAKVHDQRLAILGEDMIPPDSNIAYHLNVMSSYDGMWVRDYDYLYRQHFGDYNNWRPVLKGTKRSLELFGAQYVLAKWDWNFIDNGLREFAKGAGLTPIRREILPGHELTQTFKSRDKGLQAVMVVISTFKKQSPCELHFKLEDLDEETVLCERTLSSAELQASVYSGMHVTWPRDYALTPRGRPVVFRFEPQPSSFRRHYKITLSCPDGTPGDTVCAWSMPVNGYGDGEAASAGERLPGELLFDWSYDGDDVYEPVAKVDDYVLYRFKRSVPEFSLVGGVMIARTDDEALQILRAPEFDPHKVVVLRAEEEHELDRTHRFGRTDNSQRRVVKFDDKDFCYIVSLDGQTLARIDDEATFFANRFDWTKIEQLPTAQRSQFTFIPDTDREAKRRLGLLIVNAPQQDPHQVEIYERTPTYVRLRVRRKEPAFLVINQAYFPGWVARVDGVAAHVYRANYAFDAIEIEPGDRQVEFSYEPASLRHGLWIGLASLLVGLGSLVPGLRRTKT